MENFISNNLFLKSSVAERIYKSVQNLPIIDYHCHLDPKAIYENNAFLDIGELWLAHDHYKWRAMRMNGIDEHFITGNATYYEKFEKYASIMPNLIGNPLYVWTQLELKQVFGIEEPLNLNSAKRIYDAANEKLKDMTVFTLLKKFSVEFIATTDDPAVPLQYHGVIDGVRVTPTFRPDALFKFQPDYIRRLSELASMEVHTLTDLKEVLKRRLDNFVSFGCRMADHGFEYFPSHYPSDEEANLLFLKREHLTEEERDGLFGHLTLFLAREYKKRDISLQLHFGVTRNVNPEYFESVGVDSGFDVMSSTTNPKDVIRFLSQLKDEERPTIILYSLNESAIPAIATLTGAFRGVLVGAAWWFNDTKLGIQKNLEVISEYASLGNNLGMLTDSRSFSSYSRFDFFRRILSNYIAEMVIEGSYDENSAIEVAKNICYFNAKNLVK